MAVLGFSTFVNKFSLFARPAYGGILHVDRVEIFSIRWGIMACGISSNSSYLNDVSELEGDATCAAAMSDRNNTNTCLFAPQTVDVRCRYVYRSCRSRMCATLSRFHRCRCKHVVSCDSSDIFESKHPMRLLCSRPRTRAPGAHCSDIVPRDKSVDIEGGSVVPLLFHPPHGNFVRVPWKVTPQFQPDSKVFASSPPQQATFSRLFV